jgi:hypothetical protein
MSHFLSISLIGKNISAFLFSLYSLMKIVITARDVRASLTDSPNRLTLSSGIQQVW